MPTADEFLAQYEPNQKTDSAISADDFLSKYETNNSFESELKNNTAVSRPSAFSAKTGLPVPPTAPFDAEDAVKSAASAASRLPSLGADVGNFVVGNAIRGGARAYQLMGGEISPEAAKKITNLEPVESSAELYKSAGIPVHEPHSLSGVAGAMMGQGGGITAAEKVGPIIAEKGAAALKSVPEGVALRTKGAVGTMSPEEIASQSDTNWSESSASFKASRDAGAAIKPEDIQQTVKNVRDALDENGIMDADIHKSTLSVLQKFEEEASQGGMTLDRLDQYRKLFGKAINKNTTKADGMNEDAQTALIAKNSIMDSISNLGEESLSAGTPEAIDALRKGINQWAKAARFDRIAGLIKKSEGDATATKNNFKRFVSNEANKRGFNDEEWAAFEDAASRGTLEKLERGLGTFGLDLGKTKNIALPALTSSTSAIVPGGLPLAVAGTVLRQTGKYAARGKTQNALDVVMKRDASPPARSSEPPKPQLLLSAPKSESMLSDTSGSITPIMAGEHDAKFSAQRRIDEAKKQRLSQPTPGARLKTEQIFSQKEAEDQIAREMHEKMFDKETAETPEQLIENAAQKFQDAGVPVGEIGNALIRMLKNQEGSAPMPNFAQFYKAAKAWSPTVGLAAGNSKPNGNIGEENIQELQKVKQALPTTPSFTDKFAKAESGNNPNAKNPNSSASGLYQFTNKTWAGLVGKYGKETGIGLQDKNDPSAQGVMVKKLAQDNIQSLNKTLGRMPTKGELYIAHVLGATGAAKLINADPQKEAIMLFPRQVLDANRQIFFQGKQPRTVAQVYQLLNSKV